MQQVISLSPHFNRDIEFHAHESYCLLVVPVAVIQSNLNGRNQR